jgi:hypothetical protein
VAYGAVLKFGHDPAVVLVSIVLDRWFTFEGWATLNNCNPLELSSRRMISLMMYFVEQNLDEEGRTEFRQKLFASNLKQIRQPIRHLKAVPSLEKGKVITAKPGKWIAPPGWRPPNWNEQKSYETAKQFMGFNPSSKGKKK